MTQSVKMLSARELEVLTWAAKGKTYIETAMILGITQNTVHAHMNSLKLKLNAMNVTHAVALGYESGLLSLRMVEPMAHLPCVSDRCE